PLRRLRGIPRGAPSGRPSSSSRPGRGAGSRTRSCPWARGPLCRRRRALPPARSAWWQASRPGGSSCAPSCTSLVRARGVSRRGNARPRPIFERCSTSSPPMSERSASSPNPSSPETPGIPFAPSSSSSGSGSASRRTARRHHRAEWGVRVASGAGGRLRVASKRSLLDRLLQRGFPSPVRGYAPPPAPVAPDVWSLERLLRMPGGLRLSTRTTIVRLASRGLLVVSPPPAEPGGLEAIDALGRVDEILVPNSFHYLYAPAFAARHPGAKLRVAPGLPARVPSFPPVQEIATTGPSPWGPDIEHRVLGPVRGVSEVALFHRPSATLVVTDLAFHVRRYESPLERAAWR